MGIENNGSNNDALDANKALFSKSFTLGLVNGSDILKFFEISQMECRWLYSFEGGMTWYLLVKPKTRFLTDSIGIDREILVIATKYSEIQARLFNHIQDVSRITKSDNRFHSELVIVQGVESANTSAVTSYKKDGCIPIWIPDSVIRSEIDDPKGILTKRIQAPFFAKDFFDVAGPVSGKNFFGRSKLLQEIESGFQSGSNVGLFGLRKIGKTSVIKALKNEGAKRSAFYCHIDLLEFPDVRKDIKWVARSIYSELLDMKAMKISKKMSTTKDVNEFYDVFLDEFPEVLRRFEKSNKQIVVILDEIEKMFPAADGKVGFRGYDDLLSYLRGLSQKYSSLSIMVVGVNPHIAEAQLLGKSQNPMFGFFSIKYAPPMSLDEVREMIRFLGKSSGAKFDPAAIEYIYSSLGGHPYMTRKFCSHVLSGVNRPCEIGLSDAQASKQSFFRKEVSQFSEMVGVVKDYYPHEFYELHRIASLDDVPESSIGQGILAHLEGYQLVETTNGKVKIKNAFIKEWLNTISKPSVVAVSFGPQQGKQRRSFGDIKDELTDLEGKLRSLIRSLMQSRWGGQADQRIKKAIGDTAWNSASDRMARTIVTRGEAETQDILDYLNYGDISNIIIGHEWDVFRRAFKDKKKIESDLRIATQSRNDIMHSRQLSEVDEMRTKVAISDLDEEIHEFIKTSR